VEFFALTEPIGCIVADEHIIRPPGEKAGYRGH